MKRVLGIVLALTLMVMLLPFAAPATVSAATSTGTLTLNLIAGQDYANPIGTVTVSSNDTAYTMTVVFQITSANWSMTATHLYVDTTAPKKAAPGQFAVFGNNENHDSLPNVTTDTYRIAVPPEDFGNTTLYIAAHASVEQITGVSFPQLGISGPDPTLAELCAALSDNVTIQVTNVLNATSYLDVVVVSNNLPTGYPTTGTFPGWCIDPYHNITRGSDRTAALLCTYLSSYPGWVTPEFVAEPENLPLVNWIINQGFPGQGTYTVQDVQGAIWYLMGQTRDNGNPWFSSNSQKILDAAEKANGQDFVPNFFEGDVFTVLVVPVPGQTFQALLFEISPTPTYTSDTAWGIPSGGFASGDAFKTGWGGYFEYVP